jgi:hypothetical protein
MNVHDVVDRLSVIMHEAQTLGTWPDETALRALLAEFPAPLDDTVCASFTDDENDTTSLFCWHAIDEMIRVSALASNGFVFEPHQELAFEFLRMAINAAS